MKKYIEMEVPFLETWFRYLNETPSKVPKDHDLFVHKCLTCEHTRQTYSFQNGIYLEGTFISVSTKWISINLASKPFGALKTQCNLDLLLTVIPIQDLVQIIYAFLNHEDQTFETRNLSRNSVLANLLPVLTRVFDSAEKNDFDSCRSSCSTPRKKTHLTVFFDPFRELRKLRQFYIGLQAENGSNPVIARGICFCNNPHYTHAFCSSRVPFGEQM